MIKKMKRYFVFLMAFGLFSVHESFAAVTASFNTNEAGIDEIIELTIKSDSDLNARPDLSGLQDDFSVVSTSVVHQNYVLNGNMQSSVAWKIGLKALKTGKINVAPLTVGNEKTKPLEIVITDTPSSISKNTQKGAQTQTPEPNYALFAKLEPAKEDIYVGEQMRYVVTLIDDGSIEKGEPSFAPSTDFIIKSLDDTKIRQLADSKRQITFSYALFPLKSGKLTIPTLYFKGYAYQKPDMENFFGGGFFNVRMPSVFGLETPVNLAFNGEQVNIKPAPSDYKGAWWLPAKNVEIKSSFIHTGQKLTLGAPVMREIVIKAEGLTDTQLPELSFESNTDFSVYPEKPTGTTSVVDSKIQSVQKTIVTYIPHKSGELVLDEIKIPWYDINTHTIKEAVLPKEILHIQEGGHPQNQAGDFQNAQNMQNEQKNDEKLQKFEKKVIFHPYFVAALAFISGMVLTYLFLKPKKEKEVVKKAPKIDYLKNIERQKDLKKLRDELILWAKNEAQNQNISNLNDVASFLNNADFDRQVKYLNAAIYDEKNNTDFERKTFMKAFKKAVHEHKKQRGKQASPIPPLYK